MLPDAHRCLGRQTRPHEYCKCKGGAGKPETGFLCRPQQARGRVFVSANMGSITEKMMSARRLAGRYMEWSVINIHRFSLQLLAFSYITCAFRYISHKRGVGHSSISREASQGTCGLNILCAATRGQFNTGWHLRESYFANI